MVKAVDAGKVVAGATADVWFNDTLLSEAKGVQAKWEFKKEEINCCGCYIAGQKVVAMSGKGSLTIYKTSSFALQALQDFIANAGVCPEFTIMGKQRNDYGQIEQVILTGVTFDDLTLLNVESAAPVEHEMPFTFTGMEIVEMM